MFSLGCLSLCPTTNQKHESQSKLYCKLEPEVEGEGEGEGVSETDADKQAINKCFTPLPV